MKLKVVSVSSNHNSFGLRGMILISDNGQGWEAAANDLNVKAKGDVVNVRTLDNGEPDFSGLGFEIPHRLNPDPPAKLMKEVWGK